MKVAAAYIRVSTDDQIEFSPDSQLEKIKLYAERKFDIIKSIDYMIFVKNKTENLQNSKVFDF